MTKEHIGVCVIGAGRAGMIHARNFANWHPCFHGLVAHDDFSISTMASAARSLASHRSDL